LWNECCRFAELGQTKGHGSTRQGSAGRAKDLI
jgi:hypothetical protein